MRLVIDANIIFAALIRQSVTKDIIFDQRLELYAPEFLLDEIGRHSKYLIRKTGMSDDELTKALIALKGKINFIQLREIVQYHASARKICPDKDDIIYFALALKLSLPIWSNDKLLKGQDTIRIYNTEEIMNILDITG